MTYKKILILISLVLYLPIINNVAKAKSSKISTLMNVSIGNGIGTIAGAFSSPAWSPLDNQGWSTYQEHADTVKIYASSSGGNDSNDGLNESTPVRSIQRALEIASARSTGATIARPDWILFKAGDVWVDENFRFRANTVKGGLSIEYPFIISRYGNGPRPRFEGSSSAFGGPIWSYGWYGSGFPTGSNAPAYWAIMGLEFYNPKLDPNTGGDPLAYDSTFVGFWREGHHILFEDCVFNYLGMSVQFDTNHVALRRNHFLNNYGNHPHPSNDYHHGVGLYAGGNVDEILLEENFFDHGGWLNESLYSNTGPTIYNHNVYFNSDTSNVIMQSNISARGSSDGLKLRGGGQAINNLLLYNGIHLNINGYNLANINQEILYNVAMGSLGLSLHGLAGHHGHLPRDWGYNLGQVTDLSLLNTKGNILAHSNTGSLTISSACTAIPTCVEGFLIYDWGTSQNTIGSYPDPDRDINSYMLSLGGTPTLEAFLDEVRQQSRDNWRVEYTANSVNTYIREGFSVAVTQLDIIFINSFE